MSTQRATKSEAEKVEEVLQGYVPLDSSPQEQALADAVVEHLKTRDDGDAYAPPTTDNDVRDERIAALERAVGYLYAALLPGVDVAAVMARHPKE